MTEKKNMLGVDDIPRQEPLGEKECEQLDWEVLAIEQLGEYWVAVFCSEDASQTFVIHFETEEKASQYKVGDTYKIKFSGSEDV